MTYFPDLAPTVLGVVGDSVRAIGWLSAEHDFTRGAAPDGLLAALQLLRQRYGDIYQVFPWWPAFAGPHTCELCCKHLDIGEIAVPSDDLLFVSPTMIAHYVEVHRYLPPPAFVQAVLSCPAPGTPEFVQSVAFTARPNADGVPRVRFEYD